MRADKEIREALKRLEDEHLRIMRQPDGYSLLGLVAMIGALEWVLGDRERIPGLPYRSGQSFRLRGDK